LKRIRWHEFSISYFWNNAWRLGSEFNLHQHDACSVLCAAHLNLNPTGHPLHLAVLQLTIWYTTMVVIPHCPLPIILNNHPPDLYHPVISHHQKCPHLPLLGIPDSTAHIAPSSHRRHHTTPSESWTSITPLWHFWAP
jgi:hypothetical protein